MNRLSKRGVLSASLLLASALLTAPAPVQAQNAAQQKQIESAWTAGEKALREERFGIAVAHFNRVVAILERPEVAVEAKVLAAAFHNRADAYYNLEQWPAAQRDYSRVIELIARLFGVGRRGFVAGRDSLLQIAREAQQSAVNSRLMV